MTSQSNTGSEVGTPGLTKYFSTLPFTEAEHNHRTIPDPKLKFDPPRIARLVVASIRTRSVSGFVLVLVFCFFGGSVPGPSGVQGRRTTERESQLNNLVQNPGFELTLKDEKTPLDWRQRTEREEIAPNFELDSTVAHSGRRSAKLSAKGSPGTFGYWVTSITGLPDSNTRLTNHIPTEPVVRAKGFLAERRYRFRCYFRARGIKSIDKSISIKARWKNARGEEILGEYITSHKLQGEWHEAEGILAAPLFAKSVDLELVLQWTPTGTVWWDDVSLEQISPPQERKIKVATVSYEPPPPSTPDNNRYFFAEKVAAAGKAGADIICLGEGITKVSTDKNFAEVAESVPGPTSQVLGDVAKKYHMYVIAGIYERKEAIVYNTALLIDREGKVFGKYRKTHLPEDEVTGGVTPGDTYPVFKTDFGTVGLEICYDNFFPEVARSLALKGAEIIFLPISGDGRGNGYAWDIVARCRAIDNAVYLIASNYSQKRSLVVDPNGQILADTKGSGMVTAEIDLDGRTFDRWLSFPSYGEWKSLYPKERRAGTYGILLRDSKDSYVHGNNEEADMPSAYDQRAR